MVSGPVKNPSILIVEDNGLIAMMLKEFLERFGYRIPAPVASGEDAIEYIRNFSMPDLILMDITLDGRIDGIETTRQIRKTSDVPVVFLSAHREDSRLIREGTITGFCYINKPFDLDDVLHTVEKMLHSTKEFTVRDHRPKVLMC